MMLQAILKLPSTKTKELKIIYGSHPHMMLQAILKLPVKKFFNTTKKLWEKS
jgi:hypothetical protein